MTAWLATVFEKYPELAVFFVVGVGYWAGGFKVRGFGLGPVVRKNWIKARLQEIFLDLGELRNDAMLDF